MNMFVQFSQKKKILEFIYKSTQVTTSFRVAFLRCCVRMMSNSHALHVRQTRTTVHTISRAVQCENRSQNYDGLQQSQTP